MCIRDRAFAAAFPGLSRSGSTISTGMMCGVNKEYMVQYSFILGIHAIIAANISQTKDAIEIHQSIEVLPTVIGIITAMVVGVLLSLIHILINGYYIKSGFS